MAEERLVSVTVIHKPNAIKYAIHKETTVEELVITLCQELNIGPVARHLFALRYDIENNLWASLSTKLWNLTRNSFELRLRYRIPKLETLKTIDPNAFDYYFCQIRKDVNEGRFDCSMSYDQIKDVLLGLAVTDMYRYMLEKDESAEVVLNSYRKFMPQEMLKKHRFFLKKPIRKSFMTINRSLNNDFIKAKSVYLDQAEQIYPNYMTEKYKAEIEDKGILKPINIQVNPFHKDIPGIQYQFVGKTEVTEWHHMCAIEDLCYISLREDAFIEISRKTGIPLFLQLESVNAMVSFVSLLDGYYRLSVKWTFNLCKELPTPSLQELHSLRCHGPVGKDFAYKKLKLKRNNKLGCYILRESELSYDNYLIDVCTKNSPEQETYLIERRGEGHFWFSADERSYKSLQDLINNFKSSDSSIILSECIPSSEYDESSLLLCRVEDTSNNNITDPEFNSESNITGPPQCIHIKNLHEYKGEVHESKRRFTEVYKYCWKKSKTLRLNVAVKILKPKYRDKYLQDYINLAGTWSLLHSSAMVRLLGVTLGNPVAMVSEYLPLGPLDEYLKEHQASLKEVDLVEAATYLANAMWHLEEEGIVHGYVRCHKILVAVHAENTFSIRLSDPGLHSSYSRQDLHWIPPEFHHHLEKAKKSSAADMWAFGTTLWQIFSYGLLPNINGIDIELFYKNGERLQKPTNCLYEVYRLITECWSTDPHQRKRPQAAMRDINQLLYQVFNSRRVHSYATPKPVRSDSSDTLNNITSIDTTSDLDSSNPFNGFNQLNSEPSTEIYNPDSDATEQEICSISSEIIAYYDGAKIVPQGKIGQGYYGEVYKGIVEQDINSTLGQEVVAFKKLRTRDGASFRTDDFLNEINIMKVLKHENIVEMKAVIQQPEILLVMEFVEHGSLKCYLNLHKNRLNPELHFIKYAQDVAMGMKYLCDKKIVHRDLAARNVLVADEFLVKISDFGLAQFTSNGYYIVKTNRELPLQWHAPESLSNGKFSSQSDVWSYGVTLYEMFSFGKDPVIDCIEYRNDPRPIVEILLGVLERGTRLPCPEKCSTEVYSRLMSPCWEYDANKRPSFADIIGIVGGFWKKKEFNNCMFEFNTNFQ